MHSTTEFSVAWGVFLDRDGTLTEEVGYVNHPSRLRLIPGAGEAIRRLNRAGVPAILATNQAGVARGYFSEEVVKETLSRLESLLDTQGAHLDRILYCPHHPTAGEPPYRKACDCRKPKPGMLQRASEELALDLGRSYLVGDKISDTICARNAGASGVMVLTGYGLGEYTYQRESWREQPDHMAETVLEAVQWILEREGLA